jgi:outer membrane protein assembly factor BamB
MNRTVLSGIQLILVLALVSSGFGQSKRSGDVDPAKCWSYSTGEIRADAIFAGNPHYLLGSSGARVESVALDGKKAWSTELGGEIKSNILPTEKGVYVVTSAAETGKASPADSLRLLSTDTGITVSSQKLGGAERYFLVPQNGSLIIVASSGAIESYGGANPWKRDIAGGFVGEPAFSDGKIAVATTTNQIFVVSLANGEIESMQKMPLRVTAVGRTKDGDLLVGDDHGNAALFKSGSSKAYWKFKSGGAIAHVTEANDNILAVSNDNFVYLLDDRNGGLIWKKRFPGRIAAAAPFGKYAFVSGFEQHLLVIMDLVNGKVAGQIKLGDDETVTALRSTPRSILVLTNQALYSYSVDGCGEK